MSLEADPPINKLIPSYEASVGDMLILYKRATVPPPRKLLALREEHKLPTVNE